MIFVKNTNLTFHVLQPNRKMNNRVPQLSVILPIHNEEEGIENFLLSLIRLLREKKITAELLCVENGSTDNSLLILRSLEKQYPGLEVIESQKGWGNAVRKGIKHSHGRYIAYMVTDGQVDPKYLISTYEKILQTGADMVKVTRVTRENTSRLVNSRAYNYLGKLMFCFNTIDINGTPKIIRSDVLKKIPLYSHNITLDIELLYKMKQKNLSWKEVPVRSKRRRYGVSTTNIKSIWEMFSYMLRLLTRTI